MNYRFMLFFSFLLSLRVMVIAQEGQNEPEFKHYRCPGYITGCYKGFSDFKAGNPAIKSNFHMVRNKPKEVRDSKAGGYTLQFDKGFKTGIISVKKIWGAYYEDTLYINREFFIGKKGFDKVYCLGSYGYFHSINPEVAANTNEVVLAGMLFGAIGGAAVGAGQPEGNSKSMKFPYVMIYILDMETGMVSPLTSFKLEKILEDDQQLLELYDKEQHKSSMWIMHAYIDTFAERFRNK